MPKITRDLLVHIDSPDLTFHDSVSFPESVPVTVDQNSEAVIGRARLRRTGVKVWADIFLHEDFPGLPYPYVCIIGVTPESRAFHSEESDVNYVIFGGVEYLSLLSTDSPILDVVLMPGEAE